VPPAVIHATAAAQVPLSPRSLLRRWNTQAWRPPQCVGIVGISLPVSSLQVSLCAVACVLRLISCSLRSGSGARLYSGLMQPPRVHAVEAPPLYLQRWHWQGPQSGSWACQCAAWHAGVQ